MSRRRASVSRVRALGLLVAVTAIAGVWGWRFFGVGDDDAESPHRLRVLVDDLQSDDSIRRSTALGDAWQLLIDPIHSTLGIRVSRIEKVVPSEWFRRHGATEMVEALLGSFQSGRDEHDSFELLCALHELYPRATRALALPLDPLRADPIAFAREIAGATPIGGLALYALEHAEQRIGPLVTMALLSAYGRPVPPSLRDRLVRLLRRVPDRSLRKLAIPHRGTTGWVSPEWASLARDRGLDYRDMDEWCERGDQEERRTNLIATQLASTRPDDVRRALDRFRWDPVPSLDDTVLGLTSADDIEIRNAAVRALSGMPTANGAGRLADLLDDPEVRSAAIEALRSWTIPAPGTVGPGIDPDLGPLVELPSSHIGATETWRTFARDVASLPPGSPLGLQPSVDAARREIATLLIGLRFRRGELTEHAIEAALPELASDGLDRRARPRWRAATWAAITPFQRPPASLLVSAIVEEEEPIVRGALLDALVLEGPDGVEATLGELVRTIAATQRFDGVAVVRAYALAFPTTRLLEWVLADARHPEAERRAAAAYLVGGLTVPESAERREELLIVVELLEDESELVRYWAHESLRALFHEDYGFDPRRRPEPNRNAIRDWRARVSAAH
ncbi:MAG: hypothetical protein KDC38_17425 [Planctomycetes bacterium]|nr:hypothetical protein [Planctomycetota bacterium]